MARDEELADATTASDSGTWFADYSARFAKAPEALQQPIWGARRREG
jgi:hypothetical protein